MGNVLNTYRCVKNTAQAQHCMVRCIGQMDSEIRLGWTHRGPTYL